LLGVKKKMSQPQNIHEALRINQENNARMQQQIAASTQQFHQQLARATNPNVLLTGQPVMQLPAFQPPILRR